MDKVSIIIPVYNMGNKVKKIMGNILEQTYENIETILVDDGSQDETYEICREIINENKNKDIKLIKTNNQGAGKARNCGIDVATGKYAYFPDADDSLILNNAIEIMVESMHKSKSDLLVFGYRYSTPEGKILKKKEYEKREYLGTYVRENYEKFDTMGKEFGIQGAPWNKFFLLSIIKDNNILYPDLRRNQDEIFISRYVNYVGKVCFIDYVLYDYYVNDVNLEWKKYPTNYLDIVNQVLEYKIQIQFKWNEKNKVVKNDIYLSYLDEVYRCFDLLFNPYEKISSKEIKERISNIIGRMSEVPFDELNYCRKVTQITSFLVKNRYINSLYIFIKYKVFIKKNMKFLINKF